MVIYWHKDMLLSAKKELWKQSWVNLKSMTRSERSQKQMVKYCMVPFTGHSSKDKTIQTEYRSVVAKGWGQRED